MNANSNAAWLVLRLGAALLGLVTAMVDGEWASADEAARPPQSQMAFVRISPSAVNEQLIGWLARSQVERGLAEQALQLWADQSLVQSMTAEETLDRLVESLATVEPGLRQLLDSTRHGGSRPSVAFDGVRSDPFYQNHVRLWYGRWLTQHRYYDEALQMLDGLNAEGLADPASLLFYRASSRLRLLRSAEAADDLTLLLNNTLDVPPRFRLVGEMMLQESRPADGLPRVAQLMSDVQRRLDLGTSGEPVQKREDEVIAALDKLLKDLEQQQQQQQQSGGGEGQSQPGQEMQNSQPAEQSSIKGSAGKGDAERKELTENGAWGMLDKQQEIQARELIRQQFPPNFLDAISRYTRRLAEQKK